MDSPSWSATSKQDIHILLFNRLYNDLKKGAMKCEIEPILLYALNLGMWMHKLGSIEMWYQAGPTVWLWIWACVCTN